MFLVMIILKILKWVFVVIGVAFIAIVIYRMFFLWDKRKTDEQVARILATKLTLDDVMGKNLPPDPGALADKTVQGVDANHNGIRDDVELAIFKEYPNSAKTRAVLLQYALALQMEMVQTIVNEGTVIAAVQEESRAFVCIGDIISRKDPQFDEKTDLLTNFVKKKQLDTQERKTTRTGFYDKINSYEALDSVCDINYSKLPN